MFTYYQDAYCYYFWKPAGIPSTFGKQTSFLDCLLENSSLTRDKFFCKEKISPNSEKGVDNVVQSLFTFFGIEREL
jgi:hypothetical protein